MGFVLVDPAGNLNLSRVGGYQGLLAFSALGRTGLGEPRAKLMLSVGGGGSDAQQFKKTVRSRDKTRRFIESAVGVLRDARLDGLDLDWEFPSVFDRRQFASFLEPGRANNNDGIAIVNKVSKRYDFPRHDGVCIQEVFKAFRESPYGPFLLSVAVPAQSTLAIAYDIPTMARNVDFVNLMTYDLHIFKWYTPLTGHNSPLFSRSDELGYFATLNMQSSTELWTSMGMPKSKIMVGIPTYGLSWALLNAQSAGVGSVAVGQSKEGDGFVSYPKVCEFLRGGGTRHFDDESMVPFATNDRTWISYDDQESVAIKARWILAENFSGTMTFSLNSDDWQGTCGHGAFPLQKSILEAT
ncbi:chitotriosidase-1-like [Ixodes scapularis]|uniref:chitotriosidase-1-like n=1 Tax=Ixodes scapularis TaxID=6945 RepID=UPI001AD775FC|nr:chitotriosidase-1-like [Ixodes scapularis]